MKNITEKQFDSLVNKIYSSLIANPDFGLGEMGSCKEEAERIVRDWMSEETIIFKEN
ncbi:MAG: hypothetical protein ABIP51_05940 [Bacteroidia bacterium]